MEFQPIWCVMDRMFSRLIHPISRADVPEESRLRENWFCRKSDGELFPIWLISFKWCMWNIMNLPSIFKSSSDMKGKTQQSTPAPRDQPPQDMFGLGIQVFKIDSKKDAINNSSAGKARQNMKNFENPSKKSMTPSSQIPKQKKISGLLPNIYGQ